MVDFAHVLKNSLKFSVEPKRWLPFFIVDVAAFGVLLWFFFSNLNSLVLGVLNVRTNPLAMMPFLGALAWLVVGFLIYALIGLWLNGAIIYQSFKEKEKIEKSFRFSLSKLLSIVAAVFVITVISSVVGMVPYIGWIFSIIASLVFFFTIQAIIVRGRGFYKALRESYEIFRKDPFKVFVIWLFVLVVTLVIVFVFSLPMLGFLAGALFNLISGQADASFLVNMLFFAKSNIAMVVVVGIIFLIGLAISRVFALKAQTEFYLKMRKRHAVF